MPEPSSQQFSFEVAAEAAGERLDRAVARALPDLSRTRIQALAKAGKISGPAGPITDPSLKLKGGEAIVVEVPPPVPATPEGEAIELVVVYEDAHLLVIDKPAGLVVHPGAGHGGGTLVNALIAHCKGQLSGIGGVERPGIVHRLDKDTSGLLVVAKSDKAHRRLAAQFADHGRTGPLVRAYRALVWGAPSRPRGSVEAAIDRDSRNREKMAVVRGERGREAVTHYELIDAYGTPPVASQLRLTLETGRTHQIRVHMTHIGHPLLGDATYGTGFRTKIGKLGPAAQAALERLGRQALHAAELGFEHPITGEAMLFESELPPDLAELVAALEAL